MKRIYLLYFLTVFLSAIKLHAQAPLGINYQAVARNFANNSVIAGKNIDVKFEITSGFNGTVDYAETFPLTTNYFGLYTATIGTGNVLQGNFTNIQWVSGDKWLNVYVDTAATGIYGSPISQTRFFTVPYAFFSSRAASSGKLLMPASDQQTLFYNGATSVWDATNALKINNGTQTVSIGGTAEIQTLRINNNYTLPLTAGTSGDVLTYSTGGATSWSPLNATTSCWGLKGNSGTTPGTASGQNFMGTTDATGLVLATNNAERMRISAAGKVGIGNSTPQSMLDIVSTESNILTLSSSNLSSLIKIKNNSVAGSGVMFMHNNTDSSVIGYHPNYKHLFLNNTNIVHGRIQLNTRERIDFLADTLKIEPSSITGASTATHTKVFLKGLLVTDSLKIRGVNASNAGWILSNNGSGVAVWTNPGLLSGDHLGNHTLTQNLKTSGFWLSDDGDPEGVLVQPNGSVGIGESNPKALLSVNGNVCISNGKLFLGDVEAVNNGHTGMYADNNDLVLAVYKSVGGTTPFGTKTIDGLRVKSNTGYVGIGTANPTSPLTVNGDVEVPVSSNYKFSTPKTHYYSIDPTAFVETNVAPNTSSIQYNGATGDAVFFPGGTSGTQVWAAAPLNLPDGAVITSIVMNCVDAHATYDLSLDLFQNNTSVANVKTNGATAIGLSQTITATPGSTLIIDNQTNTYKIGLKFDSRNLGLGQMSVSKVRITYTVTNTD